MIVHSFQFELCVIGDVICVIIIQEFVGNGQTRLDYKFTVVMCLEVIYNYGEKSGRLLERFLREIVVRRF